MEHMEQSFEAQKLEAERLEFRRRMSALGGGFGYFIYFTLNFSVFSSFIYAFLQARSRI